MECYFGVMDVALRDAMTTKCNSCIHYRLRKVESCFRYYECVFLMKENRQIIHSPQNPVLPL